MPYVNCDDVWCDDPDTCLSDHWVPPDGKDNLAYPLDPETIVANHPVERFSLPDILTEEELKQIIELKDRRRVRDEILAPIMERINATLGQENNLEFMAMAVEFIMIRSGLWPQPTE